MQAAAQNLERKLCTLCCAAAKAGVTGQSTYGYGMIGEKAGGYMVLA
jgi:hypothetical protein